MAVYKLTYKGYEGESTPTWSRFLIPARYNYAKLTSIRFLMLFMTVSMFYPIYGAIYVYLSANPSFLATMGFMPFEIDGQFFYTFCQCSGDVVVSPDGIYQPQPGVLGYFKRRASTLFLPPVFAPGIRSRKAERDSSPALDNYLDTGGDSFCNQVQHQ